MNTTPPNNGPRSNEPGDPHMGNGPGNGAGPGSGNGANQDPRWDAFDDGQPKGDRPFNTNNPYAQHGGGNPQAQGQPGGQQGSPYGQVNNGGQNPYGQNPQGPGQPGMNDGQGFGNGPGNGPTNGPGHGGGLGTGAGMGAAGAGAAGSAATHSDANKKKGNKGAVIAAAVGGAMLLIIGGIAACQANDDEENAAAESSMSEPSETPTEAADESTEETTTEEVESEEPTATGVEAFQSEFAEKDTSKGRPAGTVPFDELDDGDEITLGEGLGPYQEWGTYKGQVVRGPYSHNDDEDKTRDSSDLEEAKLDALFWAAGNEYSKARTIEALTRDRTRTAVYPQDVAEKAVDAIDIDWNEVALARAKKYKERNPQDSNDDLFSALTSYDGFTPEEAQYAIDNLNK